MAEMVREDCPASSASPRAEKRNSESSASPRAEKRNSEADLTESDPTHIIGNLDVAESDESDAGSLVFTPGKADRARLMEQTESHWNTELTETSSDNLQPDSSPMGLSIMTSLREATALTAGVHSSPIEVAHCGLITPIGSEEGRFIDLRLSSRSSGFNKSDGRR